MKKHIILTVATILWLSAFVGSLYAGTYSGGTGEPNNPYQIAAAADWQELMTTPTDWDKSFLLTADIDLAGISLTPVGNDTAPFTGVFDGNNHVIRNAVINLPDEGNVGIFGYVGDTGQIRDLGAESVNISGLYYVGGLVGQSYGSITSCYSTSSVNGNSCIGGLVGQNDGGTIDNCYSTGTVVGLATIGGLLGGSRGGTIDNCYSTGTVTAQDYWAGGLVGESYDTSITSCYAAGNVSATRSLAGGLVASNRNGSITSSYATGNVTGGETSYFVGGLVGENVGQHSIITSCHSTGAVSGGFYTGGLAGNNDSGSITSCYATGNVTGSTASYYVGGLIGSNDSGSITSCYTTGNVTGSTTSYYVGGLVGENVGYHSMIAACHSTGAVSGGFYVGGLAGYNRISPITDCYSGANVNGESYVGGLVGQNLELSPINSCYASGNVNAETYVGGLVGQNFSDSLINSCCAIGTVNGTSFVGGLVGYCENFNGGGVENSYSLATVSGTDSVGGLIGILFEQTFIENCYAAGLTTGVSNVGGLVGNYVHDFQIPGIDNLFWDIQASGQATSALGIGKTTEEMQTLATFLGAGWDFVCETANGTDDIWFMPSDDYPHLTWEYTPEFDLSVSPNILWPANNKMVKITPAWTATDLCGQSLEVSLVDITANEPCNPDDIKIAPDGSISLGATRSGNFKGRIYTLTYETCDSAGHCTTQTATVAVPHDMRK